MKLMNKKPIAIAIVMMLSGTNANAIDIVNDPAHMAETIAGWAANHQDEIRQFNTMVEQLRELQQTYQMVTSTYNAVTGSRGLGAVQTLTNASRNYLPASTGDLLDTIDGASQTYNQMSGMVQNFTDQNAILNGNAINSLNMTGQQLALFSQRRKNAAAIQATAQQSMNAAGQRYAYIQQMIDNINNTNDPKAIAELQARIAGEQVMLQNDQSKMSQMYAYLQNQERINQQQMRELSVQQIGRTRDLVQPNYTVYNNP
jgi:type IV secretion system protein VirB5